MQKQNKLQQDFLEFILYCKSVYQNAYQHYSNMSYIQVIQLIVSGIGGLLISLLTSAIVNSTLVEISLSPFFSIYFGLIFMLIGGAILFKVNHDQANNSDTTFENKKPYLITFGILIIISGIISFMLEKNFFTKFKPFQKIPYYMMIAICLNFCMVFSIVDIVNYVFGYFQGKYSKCIVETQEQILLILFNTVVVGLFYGFIFGICDVQDSLKYNIALNLLNEEYYCMPFAAFFGFITGFFNEVIRIKGNIINPHFQPINDPFNEQI